MKIKILVIMLLITGSVTGQENRRITKLRKKVKEAEIFKQIETSKNECAILVSRIKQTKNIENDSLKIKYTYMKKAYDKVIDTMIYDINSVNTIGGVVEFFVTKSSRYLEYEKLLNNAKKEEDKFRVLANKELKDEKGIIKLIVDWSISFLPSWVTKISDTLLAQVQNIIISRLDEIRFKSWSDIKA